MNMKSIIYLVFVTVVCAGAFGYAPNNPVMYAPQISRSVVDGHIENWSGSQWATFGKGQPSWLQASSRTKVKFAWSTATTPNKLYIGIDTNEPSALDPNKPWIEFGGLYCPSGTADANVTANDAPGRATVLQYKNGVLSNINAQTKTGVLAARYTSSGHTYIEIATPLYSNWNSAGSAIALNSSKDVYLYLVIYAGDAASQNDGRRDCLVVDASAWSGDKLRAESCVNYETLLRLRTTAFPVNCADVPSFGKDSLDYNQDCTIDLPDYAMVAQSWLKCNDPTNSECQ